MERIEDVANPEVGKFYLVPTVEGLIFDRRDCWPVIGGLHDDKEIIGFKGGRHFHCDARFLSSRQLRIFPRSTRRGIDLKEKAVFVWPLTEFGAPGSLKEGGLRIFGPVVYRARKLKRPMPEYPHMYAPWMRDLEVAFSHRKLGPGMRCPHRGASLVGLPTDKDGSVICPLHGLKWCTKTGSLIRYEDRK